MYQVNLPNKDGWIFISHERSTEEPDSFVKLVKAYKKELNGEIIIAGDTQYKINNDPFELIFQWDSLFGNVVIVPSKSNSKKAADYLTYLC